MNSSRKIEHFFILMLLLINAVSSEIIRFIDGEIIYEYNNESEPLGKGASGTVFKGIRKQDDEIETVAFKVNNFVGGSAALEHERDIYEKMGAHDLIPNYYNFFAETNETKAALIIELLGETLYAVYKKHRPFSTVTIMRIGLQMLDILEHIHRKGVAHRDAHIGNFALNFRNDSKIYIFDFDRSFIFSPSDCVFHGKDIRRQELRILGMQLIDMMNGKTFVEQSEQKISDVISRDCKETLWKFADVAKNPENEKPDYEALRKILKTELEKHKYEPNYEKFDWQI